MRHKGKTICIAGGLAVLGYACASVESVDTPPPSQFTPDAGTGADPDTGATVDEAGNGFNQDGGQSNQDSGPCAASTATTTRSPADIIFIVDNSGSMTEEMAQIKLNVNAFAAKVGASGLDYRVIFIVALGSGALQLCMPQPLGGPACADNPPIFHHINQSVSSTNALSLLLSTYDSATAALAWNKYLRPDSYKIFILVSDDNSALAATAFDAQLLAKAPAGMFGTAAKRKYFFNAIVGWQDGTPYVTGPRCSTAVNIGLENQNLAVLTKGIIDSVCKTDYSGVFDNLAKFISNRLSCENIIPLSASADPSKVAVRSTPKGGVPKLLTRVTDISKCAAFPDGWYFDDNTTPTKVILCQTTCDAANAADGTVIDLQVGCATTDPK